MPAAPLRIQIVLTHSAIKPATLCLHLKILSSKEFQTPDDHNSRVCGLTDLIESVGGEQMFTVVKII